MKIIDLAALGESFNRDPYAVYGQLRAQGPVHRIRMPEGVLLRGSSSDTRPGRPHRRIARLSKDWRRHLPGCR
ncbi:hypothetical protein GCM10010244_82770 [Streptomyces coeruleorubidus]|nr:hypothetical protein GCM10010244_82770 [Streptomyces bellus]